MIIPVTFFTRTIIYCLFFLVTIHVSAQQVPIRQQHPTVSRIPTDSFYVNSGNWKNPLAFSIGERDTINLGTDGYGGAYIDVITDKDTTRFRYVNLPYEQWHYVPIASLTKKLICRLRFNAVPASYSHAYIVENTDQVRFAIPEVYELPNIIWALSPSGKLASNLNTQGAYYQRILTYFSPYLNHPIFRQLDIPDKNYYASYYDFRENSLCFNFSANKLVYNGPYYYVMGENRDDFNILFKELLPLVDDFALKSNYRTFFHTNKAYYDSLIHQQADLMPVRKMWDWLETRFPQRYQAYKVVFSPFIGATHSTQQFAYKANEPNLFRETVILFRVPS